MTESGGSGNTESSGETAGSSKGCLAGEPSGWTIRESAKCCTGYSFHALTAQEAYATYGGAPYAGDIIAAASALGVCVKNV